ncbi:transporter substrate-binding domain-containing protein [Pelobacter seleniigenes]|uniref:transporter substrate-binding domain-containing protein n=1 Tax=Pelobacter seleniigenes TaxID=407188 RepID=UPI000AF9E240|nr:transporter substrate-binding domain-containing protein [Pelobacter seleniigenes]
MFMQNMYLQLKNKLSNPGALILLGFTLLFIQAGPAQAGPLMDRIDAGKTIRIGFANEVPWAYPGENNKPLGFVNAYTLGVLKEMGYTNIEPVVTEWGGLIPGLKANRFDIITGGMYILNSRCQNIAFSEPMGKFGDAFIVAKGNPKGIQNYQDIKNKNAMLVTGAGYNTIEAAKKEGVAENNIMTVPGPTEILAAVKAGRADAGGMTYFTALNLAKESGNAVDVTNPSALPEWTLAYVGIGFREADRDFLKRFNAAQKKYLGSAKMLKTVEQYGYTKNQLPGEVTTAWVCKNR